MNCRISLGIRALLFVLRKTLFLKLGFALEFESNLIRVTMVRFSEERALPRTAASCGREQDW